MNSTTLRLTIAALAAALLAACGGGGSSPTPSVKPVSAPTTAAGSTTSTTSGTRLTLTYTRSNVGAKHSAAYLARQHASNSTRKSPQYLSNATNGFQVTVTVGSTATVYDISADTNSNELCVADGNYNQYTCTLIIPTLGATETIAVQDLDEQPSGTIDPTTGIATSPGPTPGTTVPGGFPAGTAVLASGSTTVTLTPGTITNVPISLNPIIAGWYDCGFDSYTGSYGIHEDYSTSPYRIVMTGNAAEAGTIFPVPVDYDGYEPIAVFLNGSSTPTFQPFIDVNGTATPLTATSTLTNVTLLPELGWNFVFSNPPASGNYMTSAPIPDTSYTLPQGDGLEVAVHYSGFGTPSATGGTLTFDNNLTAIPPAFNGTTPPPNSYESKITYTLAPVFVTAAAATVTHSTSTLVVTAYDPGASQSMNPQDCYDAYGQDLGSFSSTGPMANGTQPFVFNAGSQTGTCTFQMRDGYTGVYTNPLNITVQ